MPPILDGIAVGDIRLFTGKVNELGEYEIDGTTSSIAMVTVVVSLPPELVPVIV